MEKVKDTIYRQDAIDAMANTLWHYPNECYRNLSEYEFAKGLAELGLKSVPSAQPERKTGKWEIYIISMLDGEGCKCSECGFEGAPYWDYCPNCGSYNGGEQE